MEHGTQVKPYRCESAQDIHHCADLNQSVAVEFLCYFWRHSVTRIFATCLAWFLLWCHCLSIVRFIDGSDATDHKNCICRVHALCCNAFVLASESAYALHTAIRFHRWCYKTGSSRHVLVLHRGWTQPRPLFHGTKKQESSTKGMKFSRKSMLPSTAASPFFCFV